MLLMRVFRCALLCGFAIINAKSKQPAWNNTLDFAALEERLKNEPIVGTKGLAEFLSKGGKKAQTDDSNTLVTLKSGLKAVFKTDEYAYAEVAGYKAMKALKQRLVPPTILRRINGELGSLQFYVETSIDLLAQKNPSTYLQKHINPKDLSDMHIFYFVFGQWDLHAGNQLVTKQDGNYYLALIDNAGILHRSYTQYGQFTFVGKGAKEEHSRLQCPAGFPFDNAKTIKVDSFGSLNALFGKFIPEWHVRAIYAHNEYVRYCIWCDNLWIQALPHVHYVKPSYTKTYYASTLEAYKKLDKKMLREIWSDGYTTQPSYYDELIDLTLQRRDQLLEAAHREGTIIDD